MSSAGFEPAIPASERPQTHALDRAATRTYLLKTLTASSTDKRLAAPGTLPEAETPDKSLGDCQTRDNDSYNSKFPRKISQKV
jgi:hypothetical protein